MRYSELLSCAARDLCQSDAQCGGGLLCCEAGCGRRCRCPRAVCSSGCGPGRRCVWRRRRAVCVRVPEEPVCRPACGAGQGCRRRRWPAVRGVCTPIDLRELHQDAAEHDERDDCYQNDDDDLFDDDLFEDSSFEAGRRRHSWRRKTAKPAATATATAAPSPTPPARRPTVRPQSHIFTLFGQRTATRWPGFYFRYDDDGDDYDDDDDDHDDDDDDDDHFDADDLFDFDK